MNLEKLDDNNVLSKIEQAFEKNKLYNPTQNKFKIKLWNEFLKNGIPNKKNEEYKYTDLKKCFELFSNNLKIKNHELCIIETESEYQIIISLDKKESNYISNTSNIKIYNFNNEEKISENNIVLEKIFKDNNPLELLNNSFFIAPIILEINSYLDKRIIIKYEFDQENILLMPNIIFKIESNIEADITNIFPENKFNSIINDNINIFIEKNSNVNYNIIQNSNKNIIINNSIFVKVGRKTLTRQLYAKVNWYVERAEVIDGKNMMLFKNSVDNRLWIWNLSESWSWESNVGIFDSNSSDYFAYETLFSIDANGNGIGT